MKVKNTILILVVVILVVLAGYIYSKNKNPNNTPNNITSSTTQSETIVKKFTLNQIAEHAKPENCWLAIEGKVYDVTQFIADKKHPGGDAILSGCGKDATVLFNTRPMGSGTPHSDKARSFLPNFYIGDLTQ